MTSFYQMSKKKCKTANDMIFHYPKAKCSNDRMNMNMSILPSLELMKEMGRNEIMPFVEKLTNYGFGPKDIARLILKFLEELKKDHPHVNSIKTRVIIRGNNIDRNNILNRLIFEFEDEFMKFLENYDELKESKMLILSSFKNLIKQGKAKTINLTSNIEEYSLDENEEYYLDENEEFNDFFQFSEMI